MGDTEGALTAYEHALRHNQYSIPAMSAIACILRTRESFPKAIEYLQNIIKLDPTNGDSWGNLGHCYLMIDNLQEAYSAYQQALYHLRDPKVGLLLHLLAIKLTVTRNPSFGTELAFSTTAMAPSTTRKRRSPRSCGCSLTLKRRMKSTSAWA